jgi:TatA/E family protein of Tat protein translocase
VGEFSLSHILILSLILLIFFGPSRLPALGQSLGKAIKGFKQGLNEIDTDAKDVTHNQLNQNQQGVNQAQTQKDKQNNT